MAQRIHVFIGNRNDSSLPFAPGLSNPVCLVYPWSIGLLVAREDSISCSSAGDFVSRVIACPNCDKKPALRDELKGRALICPQCKSRFTAPADEPAPVAEGFGMISDEVPSPGGPTWPFSTTWAPPGPARRKRPPRLRQRRPSAAARCAARPCGLRRIPSGGKPCEEKERSDDDDYIGGGIVAVVLVVVLVAVAMPSIER